MIPPKVDIEAKENQRGLPKKMVKIKRNVVEAKKNEKVFQEEKGGQSIENEAKLI